MRICHVAPELLPVPPVRGGAIERWIRDGAVRLAARGHDVHVVSRDRGDGAREQAIDGVQYHYVAIPAALDRGQQAVLFRGPFYYARAARVVARLRPAVVHHHSRPAGLWWSHRLAPQSRHVLSLHSMRYGWGCTYAASDRVLFDRAFRVCARVLCVSDFIRRHTLEHFPALAGKVVTVYNGVDGEMFHPEVGRGELDENTASTILYVGRVEERKGVQVLLDAFERIVRECPATHLRLVGPHSYWNAKPSAFYTSFAARCRQTPNVELCGPTYVDAQLVATYRSGAVSVVPSVFPEALGMTSLEAQASGVPVVVSNAGGLPETVLPGESGVVFDNGDVQQLASALLGLLADSARLRVMAARARQWAMERFSWDTIAGELESVYAQVV